MRSVKDFTDDELLKQIDNAREDMDSSDYGSGDYNSVLAELEIALKEKKCRDRGEADE